MDNIILPNEDFANTIIMQRHPYIVYVKPNYKGYVTAVNSSEFLTNTTDWAEIDSGYGDKHHHAQGNYFEKPIMTMGGAYRYKLVDGKAVECTAEEINAQEEANKPIPVPTTEERVEALEAAVTMLCMPDVSEV